MRDGPIDLPARAPRVGEMVFTRSRRWLVDEVGEAQWAPALKAELEILFAGEPPSGLQGPPELMR